MCHDDKEFNLKLTKTPMVGGDELSLVPKDYMENDQ